MYALDRPPLKLMHAGPSILNGSLTANAPHGLQQCDAISPDPGRDEPLVVADTQQELHLAHTLEHGADHGRALVRVGRVRFGDQRQDLDALVMNARAQGLLEVPPHVRFTDERQAQQPVSVLVDREFGVQGHFAATRRCAPGKGFKGSRTQGKICGRNERHRLTSP